MIKIQVNTYEKRDLLKKEFLNKLDSVWGNWYIYICPRVLREFSAFVCLYWGRSECRQWLFLLVIRRNNFLSAADIRSSMVNDWLQTPLLRALRNKLLGRPLSAFDNCSANDGRAYVTTDSTMALNITSKAARDSPWFFSCVSRYIRWLATVRMCYLLSRSWYYIHITFITYSVYNWNCYHSL